MGFKIDITGMKFGRILVISEKGRSKYGQVLWNCTCDCGVKKTIATSDLRSGKTVSCGCYATEKRKENMTTHGDTANKHKARLHTIWSKMLHRCNPSSPSPHKNYAARGILVCDEWLDYTTFKEWSLLNGYDDNLTIDRIDNDKGYSADNCRWVSRAVQSRNTRNNHNITINGRTLCMRDWSVIYGINYQTVATRINSLDWDPLKALTHPVQIKRRR